MAADEATYTVKERVEIDEVVVHSVGDVIPLSRAKELGLPGADAQPEEKPAEQPVNVAPTPPVAEAASPQGPNETGAIPGPQETR